MYKISSVQLIMLFACRYLLGMGMGEQRIEVNQEQERERDEVIGIDRGCIRLRQPGAHPFTGTDRGIRG